MRCDENVTSDLMAAASDCLGHRRSGHNEELVEVPQLHEKTVLGSGLWIVGEEDALGDLVLYHRWFLDPLGHLRREELHGDC